ncbi:glucoamylase family protein [Rhodoplanes sp. TEM]|uniref:Glucoamylase family protein n=1 Tax=Rhodoplanes tepidamans TaxID=200616 RepID=A0ABT5JET9_RHOTP|nr:MULTISPECIES: glucoamylase family protein [Rhodoplanes]MDC7788205.1 glucoamylase family protein [Rhodoplanes tepidamans]MDC7983547.1 glucoamylase family protein [Rhodoplanes sp. TEM]MDQ0354210.1 cyclic beta-1,2-glucan synthetase [Rhodoplanes tepidamans]
MTIRLSRVLGARRGASPWNDPAPVREELFGVERLEQHAESLAEAQSVTTRPPRVLPLRTRLEADAAALLAAYRASAAELACGRGIVPAAEWLLDNYHLVEDQIREIRDDLPAGYYRQLPKLATGPFAGYPRVFGLAWAYTAHTDSHFDPETLRHFIVAYQRVQPLTIGELWAVAITLRIVLVENLRRLSDQITAGRAARADADALADRLLAPDGARSALDFDIAARSSAPLSEIFAAQLAKRLRDQDPQTTPTLDWLEKRLARQGITIDDAVRHAQQRQGASNVSVRNVITSMRRISDLDWSDLFESVSLVDARLRAASDFAAMDFPTRNLYRSAIELLARGSASTELEVTDHALDAARRSGQDPADGADSIDKERAGDPGYHLIAEGRRALEHAIGFRPPARLRISRFNVRLGIGGYVGAIALVTAVLLAGVVWMLASVAGAGPLLLLALVGVLPASSTAVALVDRAITWNFGAVTLPGLGLTDGIPPSSRTLVVMPTLLTGEADLLEQVERMEVHHLATGGDLTYALLSDGIDADKEVVARDAVLLAATATAIATLNHRHGPGPDGDRFLLLHRRRVYNPGQGKWMGWERKRGKLHELNRLLRGANDTTFMPVGGRAPHVPADVRYVVTLDADTRLPRDAALRLIGKMAHPLNRPKFSAAEQRVVNGYAILQPRVTPSLPVGREGSLYQRIVSGPGGIDPYAAAVSDVYQDLFGEGSYTGKGIYDVDAFEAALEGRVPENTMLSHDLFEGIFARAGLASDIEVVEDFPSRYDVAAKRQHRWVRGDWQLLPWVFGRRTGSRAVPAVGRWKMLDNLRRSLLAPFTLATFGAGWLLPWSAAATATLMLVAAVAVPAFLPTAFAVLPRRSGIRIRNHLRTLADDLRLAGLQTAMTVALLADQAWRAGDAIVRTLVRLLTTRRHLLEWTTAAQSTGKPHLGVRGFYRDMAGGTALGIAVAVGAVALAPSSWPVALPFGLLWLAAPALAQRVSRSPSIAGRLAVSDQDARALRLVARRTWRFFETFVTPDDGMLPPDNFQEDPRPVVAHRTSPTNMGLYLLSAVSARDLGWAGTSETVERLEATLGAMRALPRFRGHFYNWYGTRDRRVLEPAYVSSVDSGNLAGYLLALANACEEWVDAVQAPDARSGMRDHLHLAREAAGSLPAAASEAGRRLAAALDDIDVQLGSGQTIEAASPALKRLAEKAGRMARALVPAAASDDAPDLVFWIEALSRSVTEHDRDRDHARHDLGARLAALADTARAMAMAMDFAFLVNPDRKLLSIGYSVADRRLDPGCYDLLASEARLASLFAVAKGDVPTRHWFRLGRTATPLGSGSALVSWSGSMFEYLMPALVMRAPAGSLLEQTSRLVVARQQAYGRSLGVPWGISESAYNARDAEFTYQYSNFGVPGLGLKRGLSDDVVIAPYATGLAAMVDPHGACDNYARIATMGGRGRYGFYEALDFTPARLPEGERVAVVRTVMAHHQGMTIVAIANTVQGGRMRARFHREPMIQASELLLQERMPREVVVARPRAEELNTATLQAGAAVPMVRRVSATTGHAPITHLLSNGRYSVMLTAAGSGYSRWRDIAVTRWREDATQDDWGSYIVLRDVRSGRVWSAGVQPIGAADSSDVVFGEDHAAFVRHDGTLTTAMEVLVSGEHDGEVRRVTLTNNGRQTCDIELTSYAEVVLTTPAADAAHPAFAKLFVETEHVAELGALVATRRPRAHGEPQVFAAHFAVVEGEIAADPQYETDRARFVGRGRTVATAAGFLDGRPLSNTVGTVLDPIFAQRRRVVVPPGRTVRVAFWTVVASSRAELLDLVDTLHDRNAYDRAGTLAWTQAQVQLRHLGIDAEEAADFQDLAAPILYADRRFRAAPDAILRGAGSQTGLWPLAISGDLPIVLLRIDDVEDIAQVRQLLRAHEYWRIKRLAVDLVIVNEHASSYLQDLQVAIETAVRSSQTRPRLGDALAQGSVHTLRADLMGAEARALLQSVARVVLVARRGSIAAQIARLPVPPRRAPAEPRRKPSLPPRHVQIRMPTTLELFNGLGGFDRDGREYVIVLDGGRTTPAPWINVIANPGFGFQVAAEGTGFTFAENSRENQLTPWSNDPVTDPAGEAIFIRDEETGDLWCPTARPIDDGGTYLARHGWGYSRFEHRADGIVSDLLHYVPIMDPIKISRLTLRNLSGRPRRLSVTRYAEWVLGASRSASGPFITTELDRETGAILARNPWSVAFAGRVAFADMAGRQTAWTADRTEFIGRDGSLAAPAALSGRGPLSRATGAGLDPCVAQQRVVELAPGETAEIPMVLGQCPTADGARALIVRYRTADLDAMLAEVTADWETRLRAVEVKTPDRAMDIMLNGWLLYQTIACRIRARAAFYQASGAYGFRDQLQDSMALTFAEPGAMRSHLLRVASRQFVEGDVQHWWLPTSGLGVRTRISDDRAWLAFATATYVAWSRDTGVLDESVPFLEGPALAPGQHDALFQPTIGDAPATLFEHCARALDQSVALTGAHGLPLIGSGDWNDGMNRVGHEGRGESVWLGWLLVRTIALFAPIAKDRDADRTRRWTAHAETVRAAIEREAWDGAWYRRATFDDGTWLGSQDSDECRIDSIAQSWAVLSGAADPARAATAMASLDERLLRRGDGLALLFTPPFDRTLHDPGYIKGYPPGLRENGGQYSHAAMWAILAFATLRDGDRAAGLFAMVNPINHARTPGAVARYRIEPYVVAGDVYSVTPHVGHGGWSWYTGAAGWMYRAGIEGILGLRREGAELVVDPCIPASWPGFEARVSVGSTGYDIRVETAPPGTPAQAWLDGVPMPIAGVARAPLDGQAHMLRIVIAAREATRHGRAESRADETRASHPPRAPAPPGVSGAAGPS